MAQFQTISLLERLTFAEQNVRFDSHPILNASTLINHFNPAINTVAIARWVKFRNYINKLIIIQPIEFFFINLLE